MLCTVFYFGHCSIDICLLYCVCLFCLCGMFLFLMSFMSDCYMTEFVDLRNDMHICICMLYFVSLI